MDRQAGARSRLSSGEGQAEPVGGRVVGAQRNCLIRLPAADSTGLPNTAKQIPFKVWMSAASGFFKIGSLQQGQGSLRDAVLGFFFA